MCSFLVLHFALCCGKCLHSFQLNEDHLSQQHILRGRDKEITKIFTSQCCLPSTGTHRDISILVSSYSFLFHVGSNINYHYDLNKCLYSATHHFLFVCIFVLFFTTTTTTTSCIKVHFLFSFLTLAVSREQDRMRQAVLGVWALFKQLQTWRNLWPMTS